MKVRLVVVKGYEIPTDADGTPYRPGAPMIHIWPADLPIPEGWMELEIAEPEHSEDCEVCHALDGVPGGEVM